MKPSPRPWKCFEGGINIRDANGRHIIEVMGDDTDADDLDECIANTAEIVKRINAGDVADEVVDALASVLKAIDHEDYFNDKIFDWAKLVLEKARKADA